MSRLHSHFVRRSLFYTVVAGSIAAFSIAKADSIESDALIEQAPSACLAAAAEHYKVSEGAVTLKKRGKVKYKSSLRGVTVPIKVTLNGRPKDRTCIALKNGKFKFFTSSG